MNTRKRTSGEGSIYKRASDGRYVGAVMRDGKRTVKYGKTRREVVDKLKDVQRRAEQGRPLVDDRRTVGAFIELYVSEHLPTRVSVSTAATYAALLHTWVVPAIGSVRLDKLTQADVLAVVNKVRAAGRSPRTAQAVYTNLRAALDIAQRWQLVARNVAADVDRPTAKSARVTAYTADEARALLDTSRGDREHALWALLLGTGARRGEALALLWDDIDFDNGTVTIGHTLGRIGGELVRRDPKTEKSARTLYLAPELVEVLRAHRVEQARARLAAPYWQQTGYVFVTAHGTPLEPRNVNRSFSALCARTCVPRDGQHAREHADERHDECRRLPVRGPHALRHSFATLALDAGVGLAVISEMLGHASIRVTADTYAHVTPRATRDAAATLAGVLAL